MNNSGMNDSAGPTPPGALDRFFSWLRGLGMVRGNDRWFAGVASAIAVKAKIDPIIVRGIFVVLAILGGPGVLLYVAGWLLLPDSTGRIHVEELFRGRASALAVTAAVLLGAIVVIPLLVWSLRGAFGGPFGWGAWGLMPDWLQLTFGIVFWAIIVPAGIIWLIVWLSTRGTRSGSDTSAHSTSGASENNSNSNTSQNNSATGTSAGSGAQAPDPTQPQQPQPQPSAPFAPADSTPMSFAEHTTQFAEKANEKAEEWTRKIDEKSQEWGERGREYYERHKPGAGFVAMSLALALLAGGIAAAGALSLGENTSTTVVFGLVGALAVLALAMIVSGLRGRDSGWIGFFAFCGVIALAFAPISGLVSGNAQIVPFGNVSLRESDAGDDRAVVVLAGNVTVDLEELSSRADSRELDVWLLAGNVRVWMPETAPTKVHVNLMAGNVRDKRAGDSDDRQGGIFVSRQFDQNLVAGTPDETITVHVRLLAGNVTLLDVGGSGDDLRAEDDRDRGSDRELQQERERELELERLRDRIEELENTR